MSNKRRLMYCALAMVLLLACIGIYSKCQRKPVIESVERDTVIVYDTVPHYYPKPVEVEKVRTEYRWLTKVVTETDTIFRGNSVTDSVLVEVPITSKHYGCKDYDAWVSGYEPSLDSIKVYQRTEYITETITRTIKDNKHFFLDVGAGCEYRFNDKTAIPFAELGLKFKTGRFGIGAYGGYSHDTNESKGLPYGKAKISYDIISF